MKTIIALSILLSLIVLPALCQTPQTTVETDIAMIKTEITNLKENVNNGFDNVQTNLLTNLCFHLSQFNNVQTHRKFNDSLDVKRINNHVPEELRTHLFLTSLSKERWQRNNLGRSENGLWLSNSIKFHWLAVSKQ